MVITNAWDCKCTTQPIYNEFYLVAHPTYEVAYIVSYKLDRVNLLTTRAINYNLFTKWDQPPSSWFFVTLVVLYPEVNRLSTLGYIYII